MPCVLVTAYRKGLLTDNGIVQNASAKIGVFDVEVSPVPTLGNDAQQLGKPVTGTWGMVVLLLL